MDLFRFVSVIGCQKAYVFFDEKLYQFEFINTIGHLWLKRNQTEEESHMEYETYTKKKLFDSH